MTKIVKVQLLIFTFQVDILSETDCESSCQWILLHISSREKLFRLKRQLSKLQLQWAFWTKRSGLQHREVEMHFKLLSVLFLLFSVESL